MPRQRLLILLWTVCSLFALVIPIGAQQGAVPLAYTNLGGQLVIAQPPSDYRWIVTPPGETLLPDVRLAWSPDNTRLLFGVEADNQYSLRVADTTNQQIQQIATGTGIVRGGAWVPGGDVLVTTGDGVTRLTPGEAPVVLVPGAALVGPRPVSVDGRFFIYRTAAGFGVGGTEPGSPLIELPDANQQPDPDSSGLWADVGPLVAYWTTSPEGVSVLGAYNADTGETLILPMNSGVPVLPLAWVPGEATLIYLYSGGVQALDANCLLADGCSAGAVSPPVTLLPVNAQDVAISPLGMITYTLDGERFVADDACLASGDCTAAAVSVGQVAPRMRAFTGTSATAFTSAVDNTVRVVGLACTLDEATPCPEAPLVAGITVGIHPRGVYALAASDSQLVTVGNGVVALGSGDANTRAAWGEQR